MNCCPFHFGNRTQRGLYKSTKCIRRVAVWEQVCVHPGISTKYASNNSIFVGGPKGAERAKGHIDLTGSRNRANWNVHLDIFIIETTANISGINSIFSISALPKYNCGTCEEKIWHVTGVIVGGGVSCDTSVRWWGMVMEGGRGGGQFCILIK